MVTVGETEFFSRSQVASMTVRLSNNEDYQLRIATDSIGTVYVWVDRRNREGWAKLIELRNGEQR